MKKKLTKKQALIECRKHWQYLAETGALTKMDYFIQIKNYDPPAYLCFCCEYDAQMQAKESYISGRCTYCPLMNYAWSRKNSTIPCIKGTSFFRQWEDTYSSNGRKRFANEIVKACDKALADLIEDSWFSKIKRWLHLWE